MSRVLRPVKFQMMISPDEMAAVDEYRWRNRLRSRAEAIRQLVSAGIAENENGPAATAIAPSQEHDQPR